MTTNEALRRILEASSDPENPSPEELAEIFERVHTIAVVGISRDPQKAARRVPSYLATRGYDIIPVNPRAERIFGKDVRPDLDAVTEPVDMVLIFRPSEEAGRFVAQAAARPERPVIWLQEGIRADEEVRKAREAGLTVIQDLCAYKVHRTLHNPMAGQVPARGGQPPDAGVDASSEGRSSEETSW